MSCELTSSTGVKAVVEASDDGVSVTIREVETVIAIEWDGIAEGSIHIGRQVRRFFALRSGDEVDIWLDGEIYRIGSAVRGAQTGKSSGTATGEVVASMPGIVVRVLVSDSDTVAEGDGILVLESMKMQLTLSAPRSGIVRDLKAVQGKMVDQGAVLARIEAEGLV